MATAFRIFIVRPPRSYSLFYLLNPHPPADLHVEESWHDFIRNPVESLEGAQAYLEGLDLKLPKTPKEERTSMSSVNTSDSADAVIPDRKLHMPQASAPVRVSLSDFEFSESNVHMSLLSTSLPSMLSIHSHKRS